MHTFIHALAHVHRPTPAHINNHTIALSLKVTQNAHLYTQTHMNAQHTYSLKKTDLYTHIHMHTQTHAYNTIPRTHTHTHTRVRTRTHTYKHTHNTNTRTNIHTNTHI